jgi:hypothetical protein
MPDSVGGHVKGVGEHLRLFAYKSMKSPGVFLNVVFSVMLALVSMEKFGRTNYHDVFRFSDASFVGSSPVFNESGTPGVAVVPSMALHNDSLCHDGSDTCFVGRLQMGRSGMFGESFLNLEQIDFNVPHMIWIAAWFTTPISLFLLANATWKVFEQWMWWGLYLFIGIWDVIGLFMMIFWHHSPMYNKIMAFAYFAFSGLLMFSVRETWRVLIGDVEGGAMDSDTTGPMKGQRKTLYGSPAVPPFMQKISMGRMDSVAKPVYMLAAERVADIPVVIAHTFTRSVLILTEMFFLIPVVATTAFVMAQERVIPFDVQTRSWQTVLMFGVVVILEKARKTRLSYVTDTALVMAASVCVTGVMWFMIPEFLWFCRNWGHTHAGTSLMYLSYVLLVLDAIVNVIVNIIFITFIGKDQRKLKEFQDADTAPLTDVTPDADDVAGIGNGPVKPKISTQTGSQYTGVVTGMYWVNIGILTTVKILLVTIVLGGYINLPEFV